MHTSAKKSPGELRGWAWRLADAVATPLLPADYLDMFAPFRSGADLRGRIVRVSRETAEATTLAIRPGRGWRPHRAGQYIRIGLDIDGVRTWRAYSLTSPVAAPDGLITITVKAIPNGKMSNHVLHDLTPGTLVHLDQATGDFGFDDAPPAKTLFVTAGSGITPVIGMLTNHLDELLDAVVVHCAPTADSMMFSPRLQEWADAGRLTLITRHTETEGILTPDELDALVPDWQERPTWACGPTAMLDAFEAHWTEHGPAAPLYTERFRATIISEGAGGSVTFTDQQLSFDAPGDVPILDAGEDAGALMPSGCRMGICFGCVAPLTSGAVRDLRNGDLTIANDGDNIIIQTCISAAAGPCTIDL